MVNSTSTWPQSHLAPVLIRCSSDHTTAIVLLCHYFFLFLYTGEKRLLPWKENWTILTWAICCRHSRHIRLLRMLAQPKSKIYLFLLLSHHLGWKMKHIYYFEVITCWDLIQPVSPSVSQSTSQLFDSHMGGLIPQAGSTSIYYDTRIAIDARPSL